MEQPPFIVLIENPIDTSENNDPSGLALMDNRKGFEVLNELSNKHFLREVDGSWQSTREINWNCQPVSIVPAFAYIIALSMEIRSSVNEI